MTRRVLSKGNLTSESKIEFDAAFSAAFPAEQMKGRLQGPQSARQQSVEKKAFNYESEASASAPGWLSGPSDRVWDSLVRRIGILMNKEPQEPW